MLAASVRDQIIQATYRRKGLCMRALQVIGGRRHPTHLSVIYWNSVLLADLFYCFQRICSASSCWYTTISRERVPEFVSVTSQQTWILCYRIVVMRILSLPYGASSNLYADQCMCASLMLWKWHMWPITISCCMETAYTQSSIQTCAARPSTNTCFLSTSTISSP